jgi:hypothetical protein
MARGWESKSIEAQIESQQNSPAAPRGGQMTPEQMEAQRQLQVLLLARKKILGDLEGSKNARHQEQLRRALADIEARLAALEKQG